MQVQEAHLADPAPTDGAPTTVHKHPLPSCRPPPRHCSDAAVLHQNARLKQLILSPICIGALRRPARPSGAGSDPDHGHAGAWGSECVWVEKLVGGCLQTHFGFPSAAALLAETHGLVHDTSLGKDFLRVNGHLDLQLMPSNCGGMLHPPARPGQRPRGTCLSVEKTQPCLPARSSSTWLHLSFTFPAPCSCPFLLITCGYQSAAAAALVLSHLSLDSLPQCRKNF